MLPKFSIMISLKLPSLVIVSLSPGNCNFFFFAITSIYANSIHFHKFCLLVSQFSEITYLEFNLYFYIVFGFLASKMFSGLKQIYVYKKSGYCNKRGWKNVNKTMDKITNTHSPKHDLKSVWL